MHLPELVIIERWAKIWAVIVIPILIMIIPQCYSNNQRERELYLKYMEIAVPILQNENSDMELLEWASNIFYDNSPSDNRLPEETRDSLARGLVSLSPVIAKIHTGEHVEVAPNMLIDILTKSEQFDHVKIKYFLTAALEFLKDHKDTFSYNDRWDTNVDGGKIFIYRTNDPPEFVRALDGVIDVLDAVLNEKDIQNVKITIRGTRRFFDVDGLNGLNSRAWIGFDLR